MRNRLDEEDSDRLLSQQVLAMAYEADGQMKRQFAVEAKVLRDDHPSRLISQEALTDLYAELTANPDSA